MATPDVNAGTIMDSAAVLLNDAAKQEYTYAVQLPLLKIALKELREWEELNNSQVTDEVSAVITVPHGVTVIGFNTTPALPQDLIEIQQLWERETGIDPFVPMVREEFLPHYLEGQEINAFLSWAWESNEIRVLPAQIDIDIKLDYIKTLFADVTDQNSILKVINCDSFLHYKTAALCAEFIGENPTRAQSLNGAAYEALDRLTGIDNKGKQAIFTRRRPFRAGWKSRGLW